ncbi:hypothetical protein DCAR_0521927 [Daucus carota subsp. sativus]|uniref:Serine aminopeptidase S33 domain-containing protein n=1 Tax=Daucus carota subsp. sativus TaxID=79200 RepID=A0AAF0X705_DAUCS|nr:hypothetical protein DCAR_0521927 [Daucus carota subsp. sativus]
MASEAENVKFVEVEMKLFSCKWLPDCDPKAIVADDIKPNQMVRSVLEQLARVISTWRIISTLMSPLDITYLDQEKEFHPCFCTRQIRSNPYCHKGVPRLQTGFQLMQTTSSIKKILPEVLVPFLVVHDEADKVTDPAVSKLLYETASSSDKTIKLYPGLWHSLSYGELPENLDIIFSDVIAWLNKRVVELGNGQLEKERKIRNDTVETENSSQN